MTATRIPLFLLLAACASAAWGGTGTGEPHLGYLFPAGGRQGSVFELTVAGQFLRGATGVHVSGDGVRASVIRCYRPARNLQKEQRDELVRRLTELRDKRLAELPDKGRGLALRLPGERSFGKGKAKPKSVPKDDAAKKKDGAKKEGTKKEGAKADPARLPDHPLLRDMEKKSLRELLDVANEFLNPKAAKKKQPNAQLGELALIEVSIDPGAAPGDRQLRLRTPLGLSNPMCFQVGTLPEVREQEPNDPKSFDPLPKGPPLALPVVLNGQILPGDVDRFRFRATKGQQLVVATSARHLLPFLADAVPGWFQATVALYDAKGREMAFADDYRFDPDPVLFYKVPADGHYELEIRDSIYRGREDFVYRIAVGELPFITEMFPLGGRAGSKTHASVDGWNLSKKRMRLDTGADGDGIRYAAFHDGPCPSNPIPYAVDALPEHTEAEPNDSPKKAERLAPPTIVNGRIGQPGDEDVFRFEGRAGDDVVAEVRARRLHSPLDSLVWLADSSGRVLTRNDDCMLKDGHLHTDMGLLTHHADSCLSARLPHDGVYTVHIADAQGHGGDAYGYRLRVGPPQPDFALHVTPSSLSMAAGCSAAFTVHVLRKEGFDGDITLALKGAPPGFTLSGARVPQGRDCVRMTLTAPSKAPDHPIALHLEGRAQIGGKTVSRPAVPSDDVMQAFLYRHLAPSRELMVAVAKPRWNALPLTLAKPDPVRVPAGGTAQVRLDGPGRARGQVRLTLSDPPKGITIEGVTAVPNGVAFRLKADGDAAKAGLAGNLIVEAHIEVAANAKGKAAGKAAKQKQRLSLGALPAIPFVVVQP